MKYINTIPIYPITENDSQVLEFCNAFLNLSSRPKFIFGRNEYAESIANLIEVDGFIDDFTSEREYLGKPVCITEDCPKDALVVVVVVVVVVLGRPLTAKRRLIDAGLEHLDYFSFYNYSGLSVKPVTCWNDFLDDFKLNQEKYEWIYNLFSDDNSKKTFESIINFRLTGKLKYMDGFTDRQKQQYFEEFLNLSPYGEVFVDVGGFDGYTSLEFIKRCPNYKSVHFFEPEKKNMLLALEKLRSFTKVRYYEIGLSDIKGTCSFSSQGSCSCINGEGELQINIDRLDNLISEPVSYIKMDIEGAEKNALLGAKNTIIKYHPRLAVSVYHRGDDFWMIPEQILSYRDDYSVFLRHYTEGVDETVMYFIPKLINI